MGEFDISKVTEGDQAGQTTDASVAPQTTDGATDQKETTWTNQNWTQWLGYYKEIAELKRSIDAIATWTVGKGFKSTGFIRGVLLRIRGFKFDTMNTVLENCIRTYHIGGDSYCQIVKLPLLGLVNLKPLDPGVMRHVANRKGIIIRFEQIDKTDGKTVVKKFKPEEIFYLGRNRIADEIHGTSMIEALEWNILALKEAREDMRTLMHRHVKPLVKFILNTDKQSEIDAFKAKADKMLASGDNLYLPKDTAEHEIISVPSNSTLNPLPWMERLKNDFYQATGVPQIIVGGSQEFTEATAKIAYLAFQQTVQEEQLFIEEQVQMQLGIKLELEFPASLENELLSDEKKDGAVNIDPSETTAGEGQ